MKAEKYITGLALINLIFISCSDDFLELSPISNMNEEDYYQTENDFETAVTAAYATLYTEYDAESGVSYCGEQMSDEATLYSVAGNTTDRWAFKNYELLSTNSIVEQIWEDGFTDLNTVNTVIKKLQESSLENTGLITEYEAEMRFLRALYNFNLVRMFGDIPLLKEPVGVSGSYDVLRSPESDVYNFIISDLKFASQNLPFQSQVSRTGQATKGAAQGILGKVYLTVGKQDSARIVLYEVIRSEEYELLTDYSYLWDLKHENSKEALFEIQYIGGTINPYSDYWPSFAPFENFTITTKGGGMNQVTDYLWSDFEEGDPRRDLSIFDGYYDNSNNWVSIQFPKKWVDKDAQVVNEGECCENNFIVLRYADVLLMYAEATDDAEYLNRVRRRAGMPEYGSAGYPSDLYPTLDLAIEHEREVELALEFHRWFDLKRTGRAIPVLSERKGKTITKEMLVLPVPQSERDINPELSQNPDY